LRKIPKDIEKKVFKLWLEGHTYREISPKCGGVSLATISKVVEDARKRASDIDELRQLNVTLRKGGSSVYDAIRGGKVLDGLNNFGVSLDHLESYIRLTERISLEKDVGSEKFVGSSMNLISLEQQTGKTYGEVIKDFEQKLAKIAELESNYEMNKTRLEGSFQKLKAKMKREIEGLEQEIKRLKKEEGEIKGFLEAQGLSWNEGIQILKDVKDLRDEQNSLQSKIAKHTLELSNWEKEEKRSRSTIYELKTQISNLRRTMEREEEGFHNLLDQILSAQDRLHAIEERKRELEELVKGYGDIIIVHEQKERIASLQAEIQSLTEETTRLKANVEYLIRSVNRLKDERETLQSTNEEQIKKVKELAEQIVTQAKQESEQILAVAREKKKILTEANLKLKEETEFLKKKLQQLDIDIKKKEKRKAENKEEPEKPATERTKKIEGIKEAETEPVKVQLKEEIQKPPEESSALDKGAPNWNLDVLTRLSRMEKNLDAIVERRRETMRKSA
jgi:chromosome segregation ATPase